MSDGSAGAPERGAPAGPDPAAWGPDIDDVWVPNTDWVWALEQAAHLFAGYGPVLLGPVPLRGNVPDGYRQTTDRRQFIETALWFYVNLRIPPGEGETP